VRHALARHARLRTFAAGEVLCRAGEPVDRLIVTITGQVRGGAGGALLGVRTELEFE
jgi:CRP-like cAMP-binding protein